MERLLGDPLEPLAEGLWRGTILERPMFLVSNDQLGIDRDSVPLHLVTKEPIERGTEVAHQVAAQPDLWKTYGPWLAVYYPTIWQEVMNVATNVEDRFEKPDFDGFLDRVGVQNFLTPVNAKRIIEALRPDRVVHEMGTKSFIDALTTEQREELKRLLQ